jgi:hypothetical protein
MSTKKPPQISKGNFGLFGLDKEGEIDTIRLSF